MLKGIIAWLEEFDGRISLFVLPVGQPDQSVLWEALPSVIGAIIGGLISALIAFWVTRKSIVEDRKLHDIARLEREASQALSGFAKLRRYAQVICHAESYIEEGVLSAKDAGLSEDEYMQMMGGLLGDFQLPNRLEMYEIAFLYKPDKHETINRINDLEELSIFLNQLVYAFSIKRTEFERILMDSSQSDTAVQGSSVIVERRRGDRHILELHLRDMLAAIRKTLAEKPFDEFSIVHEYVEAAHEHFGNLFPKMEIEAPRSAHAAGACENN